MFLQCIRMPYEFYYVLCAKHSIRSVKIHDFDAGIRELVMVNFSITVYVVGTH